jgi:hypothetical protein
VGGCEFRAFGVVAISDEDGADFPFTAWPLVVTAKADGGGGVASSKGMILLPLALSLLVRRTESIFPREPRENPVSRFELPGPTGRNQ